MKARHDWHHSAFGRLALFLGGLRLAVPVMVLVAIALAVGTYLDSTEGAKVAFRFVYGAAWFIALMGLVCVSLVFAVVTRFPWQRRHIGFITVHAGLIILIVGGFWSLFGRLEGRVMLVEGDATNEMEINTNRLELVAGDADSTSVLAWASGEDHVKGKVKLRDVTVEVVERWANTAEERYIADDGPAPMRAVEVTLDPRATDGQWIAEANKSGGPAFIGGLTLRVLGAGEAFEPPAEAPVGDAGYAFTVNGQRYPLAEEGAQAFPGWTITALRRFESALVDVGGLTENPDGSPNPAVDVTISNGQGTSERHTAFENFPDMVLSRTLEGSERSGAQLKHEGGSGVESLVIYGDPPAIKATYVGQGKVQTFEHAGPLPWTFQAGGRSVTILSQVARARMASRFIEAAPAAEFRPALVVKVNGGDPQPIAWKSSIPVPGATTPEWIRFGPRRVVLPFTIRLKDFRKRDYPGTAMAMAYESDVTVTEPGGTLKDLTVYMNNPYAFDSWKVYQSGFIQDNISIFSVMRDPGLPLTYLGCLVLCVGIPITFYARALSAGHPGVTRPLAQKELES